MDKPREKLIAVVDDDASIRDTTNDLLESAGYDAISFPSPEQFLNCGGLERFGCLITDLRMPGMNGLELQQRLAASGHPIPTIIMTAYPDEASRAQAGRAGVLCYLSKPFAARVLLQCIDTALRSEPRRP